MTIFVCLSRIIGISVEFSYCPQLCRWVSELDSSLCPRVIIMVINYPLLLLVLRLLIILIVNKRAHLLILRNRNHLLVLRILLLLPINYV